MKAFSVIEALARDGVMGVSEISEKTGLTKSLVYRFLQTLTQLGYVKQNQDNDKYDLTVRLFEMGGNVLGRSDVLTAAHAVVDRIARQTKESVHVAVLEERDIVYVDSADSSHVLSMSPRIGGRASAYCTALGRVLLAGRSDQEIEELYRNVSLPARTKHTVTTFEALMSILQTVRTNRCAVDREEYEEGLLCVATPLQDHSGSVVAAMALAAPRVRLPGERIKDVIEIMKAASGEVARLTGASSDRQEE